MTTAPHLADRDDGLVCRAPLLERSADGLTDLVAAEPSAGRRNDRALAE